MKLIMQLSPASCYFLPFRLKYLPQQPNLKHTHSMFFHYCDRLSFTTI